MRLGFSLFSVGLPLSLSFFYDTQWCNIHFIVFFCLQTPTTFHTGNFFYFTLFYCILFHWFVYLFVVSFRFLSPSMFIWFGLLRNASSANAEGRETKKRTTLARLLKGLKTVNRRDRTNNQNTNTQVRVSWKRTHHIVTIWPKRKKQTECARNLWLAKWRNLRLSVNCKLRFYVCVLPRHEIKLRLAFCTTLNRKTTRQITIQSVAFSFAFSFNIHYLFSVEFSKVHDKMLMGDGNAQKLRGRCTFLFIVHDFF